MNVARPLSEKLAELPAARRRKVEARAAELIAEEMSLRELRNAMGKTQAKVAAALGVGQDSVARYEQRTDMLLSTLSEYVRKVGGTLELTARFPNRAPIRIKGFGVFSPAPKQHNIPKRAPTGRSVDERRLTSVRKSMAKGKAHRKDSATANG
jgi:transcriptional regulator with XRE-family HTH domain